jgi:hypothetical protein
MRKEAPNISPYLHCELVRRICTSNRNRYKECLFIYLYIKRGSSFIPRVYPHFCIHISFIFSFAMLFSVQLANPHLNNRLKKHVKIMASKISVTTKTSSHNNCNYNRT